MAYWQERIAKAQDAISRKKTKEIEKQFQKYYASAMKRTIADFEATYEKILNTIEDGRQPTPADLYKLDKYWQMQGSLKKELQRLGDKEIALLSKKFEEEWYDVYKSISLPSQPMFSTISQDGVRQMINQIWVADGKSWSQRIWENTEKLAETLNEGLIHCVSTGQKTSQLKKALIERFNVSYNNADMLVRTEMAHIQTQAAKQRYQDYGLDEVEVLVDEDERTCPICSKLEGKRYPINAVMPVPAHPRCRCCMVPVIK